MGKSWNFTNQFKAKVALEAQRRCAPMEAFERARGPSRSALISFWHCAYHCNRRLNENSAVMVSAGGSG